MAPNARRPPGGGPARPCLGGGQRPACPLAPHRRRPLVTPVVYVLHAWRCSAWSQPTHGPVRWRSFERPRSCAQLSFLGCEDGCCCARDTTGEAPRFSRARVRAAPTQPLAPLNRHVGVRAVRPGGRRRPPGEPCPPAVSDRRGCILWCGLEGGGGAGGAGNGGFVGGGAGGGGWRAVSARVWVCLSVLEQLPAAHPAGTVRTALVDTARSPPHRTGAWPSPALFSTHPPHAAPFSLLSACTVHALGIRPQASLTRSCRPCTPTRAVQYAARGDLCRLPLLTGWGRGRRRRWAPAMSPGRG